MPKGPAWNESWDRLLIMFKYLTTMQYERIAAELREIGKPWCTIVNHDIRSRLRHKWNGSLGQTTDIALPSWPFSIDLKMGNGLRGEDFRDVKLFIENVVEHRDLNPIGLKYRAALQHMEANPHLFPKNGVPDNMPLPPWMGYGNQVEADPRPAVQIAAESHSPPKQYFDPPEDESEEEDEDHEYLGEVGHTPRMTPSRTRKLRVSDPDYKMILQKPNENHKDIHPVLIASLDQIQNLANNTMTIKQFRAVTRGSDTTINPRPDPRNPVFRRQHGGTYALHPNESGFPYAAATTVMFERLSNGDISLDQFMDSLPNITLAYLPGHIVNGQQPVQRLVALNQAVLPPKTPRKRKRGDRRRRRVRDDDQMDTETVDQDAELEYLSAIDPQLSEVDPFSVDPFAGDPFEPLQPVQKRQRTGTVPTEKPGGTLTRKQVQRRREAEAAVAASRFRRSLGL